MPGNSVNYDGDAIASFLEAEGFDPKSYIGNSMTSIVTVVGIPVDDDGEFYLRLNIPHKPYFQANEKEKLVEWLKITAELFGQ